MMKENNEELNEGNSEERAVKVQIGRTKKIAMHSIVLLKFQKGLPVLDCSLFFLVLKFDNTITTL